MPPISTLVRSQQEVEHYVISRQAQSQAMDSNLSTKPSNAEMTQHVRPNLLPAMIMALEIGPGLTAVIGTLKCGNYDPRCKLGIV